MVGSVRNTVAGATSGHYLVGLPVSKAAAAATRADRTGKERRTSLILDSGTKPSLTYSPAHPTTPPAPSSPRSSGPRRTGQSIIIGRRSRPNERPNWTCTRNHGVVFRVCRNTFNMVGRPADLASSVAVRTWFGDQDVLRQDYEDGCKRAHGEHGTCRKQAASAAC